MTAEALLSLIIIIITIINLLYKFFSVNSNFFNYISALFKLPQFGPSEAQSKEHGVLLLCT